MISIRSVYGGRAVGAALLALAPAIAAAQTRSSPGGGVDRSRAAGVVVVDLRPGITGRPLRNGPNVIYTTANGVRLIADVRGLQMWSYSSSAPAGLRSKVRVIRGPIDEEQRRQLKDEIDRAARNAEERREAWARAEELLDAQRVDKGCWVIMAVTSGDGGGSMTLGYTDCPKGI